MKQKYPYAVYRKLETGYQSIYESNTVEKCKEYISKRYLIGDAWIGKNAPAHQDFNDPEFKNKYLIKGY